MLGKVFICIIFLVLIGIHLYGIKSKANWYYYPENTMSTFNASFFTVNLYIRKWLGEYGVTTFGIIQIALFVIILMAVLFL